MQINLNKKSKIALLIVISFFIVIFIFCSVKLNALSRFVDERNITEIEKAMSSYIYNLPIVKGRALSILSKIAYNYQILNLDDFGNLSNNDWNEIFQLSLIIEDLNVGQRNPCFRYICKLYDLKKYKSNFLAYKWMDSSDYVMWTDIIDSNIDLNYIINAMRNYSFEDYKSSPYINEIIKLKNQCVSYLNRTISSASSGNSYELIDAKNRAITTLYDIADVELKIIEEKGELEQLIANLPKL